MSFFELKLDLLVTGRNELLARGAKLHIHYCGYVISEHIEGSFHLPHVENVQVMVLEEVNAGIGNDFWYTYFIGYNKVECFHRIPGYGIGGHAQYSF